MPFPSHRKEDFVQWSNSQYKRWHRQPVEQKNISTTRYEYDKDAALELLNTTEEKLAADIESEGKMEYVQSLRDYLLGRDIVVHGRTIVDDQGAMILSEHAELKPDDGAMLATEIRAQWGVN